MRARSGRGELPPRSRSAPLEHERILSSLPHIRLTILIGQYALRIRRSTDRRNLAGDESPRGSRMRHRSSRYPHPSPRNQDWLKTDPWFDGEIVPMLRENGWQNALGRGRFPAASGLSDLTPQSLRIGPQFSSRNDFKEGFADAMRMKRTAVDVYSRTWGHSATRAHGATRMSFRDRCWYTLRCAQCDSGRNACRFRPESAGAVRIGIPVRNFLRFDTAWIGGGGHLEPRLARHFPNFAATCPVISALSPCDHQANSVPHGVPSSVSSGYQLHVSRARQPLNCHLVAGGKKLR